MEEQAVNNPIQQATPNPVSESKKPNYWIIAAIILVFVVFIASIFILLLSSQRSTPPPPTSIAPTLSPTPDETANWKTYKNEKFGFLFKYPENQFPNIATEAETDKRLGLLIARSDVLSKLKSTDTWIMVSVQTYPVDLTLDEYLNLDGIEDEFKDATKEIIKVNGNQSYKIIRYPNIAKSEYWYWYVGLIKKDAYIYRLEYGAFSKEIFMANESLFDQILSTFKFLDQENQVVCTLDAKLCPDGSYVSRQPPKCEFAACPQK